MAFSWKYQIDLNNDGDFGDANEDISADVIEAQWRLGMGSPYQMVADEATLSLTVKNNTGKYNPEIPGVISQGIQLPRRVRVVADNGGVETVMWVGRIVGVKIPWSPAGTATGRTTAVIECEGDKQLLDRVEIDLGIYQNVTGDVIIADVLQSAIIPPAVGGVWILGKAGYSELGVSTFLGDASAYSVVETGTARLATFGDRQSYSGWSAIKEVTEHERGKFFFQRDGKAVWWNRQHFLTILPSTYEAVTTDGNTAPMTPVALDYAFMEGEGAVANVYKVEIAPRQDGGDMVLWELDSPVNLPAGETVKFQVTYRDSNGRFMGAVTPAVGTALFSLGDGTVEVDGRGNRALVTVTNSSDTQPAILQTLTIRGNAIRDMNPMTAEVMTTWSISTYGRREKAMTFGAFDQLQQAETIANFEAKRTGIPRGIIKTMGFVNKADGAANLKQLSWAMGKLLRLGVAELRNSYAYYFIIGEEHTARAGGVHRTRYVLEPAHPDYGFHWLLGVSGRSELGSSTVLGY